MRMDRGTVPRFCLTDRGVRPLFLGFPLGNPGAEVRNSHQQVPLSAPSETQPDIRSWGQTFVLRISARQSRGRGAKQPPAGVPLRSLGDAARHHGPEKLPEGSSHHLTELRRHTRTGRLLGSEAFIHPIERVKDRLCHPPTAARCDQRKWSITYLEQSLFRAARTAGQRQRRRPAPPGRPPARRGRR
jgi:hypothetical protein